MKKYLLSLPLRLVLIPVFMTMLAFMFCVTPIFCLVGTITHKGKKVF